MCPETRPHLCKNRYCNDKQYRYDYRCFFQFQIKHDYTPINNALGRLFNVTLMQFEIKSIPYKLLSTDNITEFKMDVGNHSAGLKRIELWMGEIAGD